MVLDNLQPKDAQKDAPKEATWIILDRDDRVKGNLICVRETATDWKWQKINRFPLLVHDQWSTCMSALFSLSSCSVDAKITPQHVRQMFVCEWDQQLNDQEVIIQINDNYDICICTYDMWHVYMRTPTLQSI